MTKSSRNKISNKQNHYLLDEQNNLSLSDKHSEALIAFNRRENSNLLPSSRG